RCWPVRTCCPRRSACRAPPSVARWWYPRSAPWYTTTRTFEEGSGRVDYKYISADNHIDMLWLPKNLWQDRVAQKYRDRAPRVVETQTGSFWQWEGRTQTESEAATYTTTTA